MYPVLQDPLKSCWFLLLSHQPPVEGAQLQTDGDGEDWDGDNGVNMASCM